MSCQHRALKGAGQKGCPADSCRGAGHLLPVSTARERPKGNRIAVGLCPAVMRGIQVTESEQLLLGVAALEYKYDGEHLPITAEQIIRHRQWDDNRSDLWTTFNRIQENVIKGDIPGRTKKENRARTREVTGIDGDIKLNQALWKKAQEFEKLKS